MSSPSHKNNEEEKPRTLDEICEEVNFSISVLGNIYCGLALSRKILCKYQSDKKDHNGCYPCTHPLYNPKLYNPEGGTN